MIEKRIGDELACADCTVELHLVTTLVPPVERAGFVGLPPISLARDGGRSYYAGPMAGDFVVGVFDASGAYVRGYGRRGGGPEEFIGPPAPMTIRIGAGDSLYIAEGPYLHVLKPGAAGAVKKTLVRLVASDAVILGGVPVLQWPVRAPNGGGTPIQVLAEDGTIALGIGVTSARPMNLASPYGAFRRLTRARHGRGVWSAYINRYELSRFALSGREEVRVVRDAAWFREYEDELPGEMIAVPSRPRVEGILEPATDVLWVAVSHADRRMERRTGSPAVAREVPVDPDIDLNSVLDTTVEVMDLAKGTVIARRRFDAYLRFVDAPDGTVLLYAMRAVGYGDLVCDVFEAAVVQGSSSTSRPPS